MIFLLTTKFPAHLIAEREVFAGEDVLGQLQVRDEEQRGGEGCRQEEGKSRCQEGLSDGDLGLCWMEDESVSVQGNKEDGK